ncbi:aromatic amino acid ammonia-lyase [Streptomyces sp. NPDC000594]|uniref:HAL/PAL/TAL family ammonia-lyase n=1 Tax=Streptomyces sp. NPDC000594 TaxID=3154261 RepID=UPI00331712D4
MSLTLPAPLTIGAGPPLTPADVERAAAGPLEIRLGPGVRERVGDCHTFALRRMTDGHPVYGATTGFGPLVGFPGRADAADQCDNTLSHLTAGQGPDLEPALARATMLVRLASLCQGHSGASPTVVDALTAALATDFAPAVPRLGSLGASGDLVPLAYVAQALRGEGAAHTGGRRLPAREALALTGLTPVELGGRDALALVNGTSLTTAVAALAVASLLRSRTVATLLSGVLTDALGAEPAFLAPELLAAFGHRGTVRAGAELRALLAGQVPSGTRPLQEPYSVRCVPQLLGAAAAGLDYAREVVATDLGAVSDNPLFFPESDLVTHGGNFFGQPAAFACDQLTVIAVQLGNLAERQLDLLIDPHRNGGLPPMLSVDPGRQHAFQGVQLVATAMVAAMRRSVHPASAQSLPTNLHNQDVIPFGTQAALNAWETARLLRLLHGSLALALRQAAHLGNRRLSPGCAEVIGRIAEVSAPVERDRPLDEEVRRAADLLDSLARRPGAGSPGPAARE